MIAAAEHPVSCRRLLQRPPQTARPYRHARLPAACRERDLVLQHEKRPKLEANLVAAQQRQTRQPRPLGLGGQPWKAQQPLPGGARIAFIVTTSDSLQQIRVWISYHRAIGVTTFYIFAEGQVRSGGRLSQMSATG